MALYYNIVSLTNDATGIKEIINPTKTLKALAFPRTFLSDFSKLPEAEQAGVYILYNTADKNELPHIYIGQSGFNIAHRLHSHNKTRDFWDYALVFVEKGDFLNLNGTHAKIMESTLINQAQECGVVVMDNVVGSNSPRIQESDRLASQTWAEEAIVITQLLGLSFFVKKEVVEEVIERQPRKPSVKPLFYTIGHDRLSFSTWKEMLVTVCEKGIRVYGADDFSRSVTSHERFIKKSRRIFSYIEEDMRNFDHVELSNGLFLLTNYSSQDILNICRELEFLFPILKLDLIFEERT